MADPNPPSITATAQSPTMILLEIVGAESDTYFDVQFVTKPLTEVQEADWLMLAESIPAEDGVAFYLVEELAPDTPYSFRARVRNILG